MTRRAVPLRRFLDTEVAGSAFLLGGAVVGLVLANSPLQDSYFNFLDRVITIGVGRYQISEDVLHWINDGLMAIFFFVVGLEIKRELVRGELSSPRRAALPIAAALGGMIVPALIYVAFNAGTDAANGWGIPMATDIAFAVGVLALVAPRAPSSLRVFLLSLAIADDIGAILVIALFYSGGIRLEFLLWAAVFVMAIAVVRTTRLSRLPVYAVLAVATWIAAYESSIHPTIAGVVLGLMAPARADDSSSASVAERLEYALHPWSSYVVVPIFAFANAGIVLTSEVLEASASSTVTIGVLLGLVVGKLVGISLFTRLAVRFRLGELPGEMTVHQVSGVAALAGIGFTVSIFISSLAFIRPEFVDQAKIGILVASVVASIVGALLLRRVRERNVLPQSSGDEGADR